jgi:Transglutaminase-like superfamily
VAARPGESASVGRSSHVTVTTAPVIPRGEVPLTAEQRIALVAEILTSYCAARWALHRYDLRRAVAQLREPGRAPSRGPAAQDDQTAACRLGYIVSRTLPLLPTESRCLMRSLVLLRLLARRGVPCSLVIGVATVPKVQAHAWVEIGGRPALPAYEALFTRLVEI